MKRCVTHQCRSHPRGLHLGRLTTIGVLAASLALLLTVGTVSAQMNPNEPGIIEPVTTALQGKEIRIPNSDQSVDGDVQSTIEGDIEFEDAFGAGVLSSIGKEITQVSSPNDDMRLGLQAMLIASQAGNEAGMQVAANELMDILRGTTDGRIYDGFSMLNFNRYKDPSIGPEYFQAGLEPDEYKFKRVRDTGETFENPYIPGDVRKVWEVDVNMLYYDGQIDSDTFLVHFPAEANEDDTVRVNYRVYSLVQEDFSPTVVMLDRRQALNSVQFPFKGMDAVWIAMFPGQVMNVSINYATIRQWRGVYTWGWREHPPRIQFLQPVYDIFDRREGHEGETVRDPQSLSFIDRNREDLTIETIGESAPEKKMYRVAEAVLNGASPATIEAWLSEPDQGPAGMWFEWADLAKIQTQLPPEVWEMLAAEEGLAQGDFGDYNMITALVNNEAYGEGPFSNEVISWDQGDTFKVKLVNLDNHTHYFRNVDFGPRLHDDILRCCGGGETSFEIMNFKPSYGAPKVAEMQWRAGWGFRPHYDVIQQQDVFPRGKDRVRLTPYVGGEGGAFFGYQYSEEFRGGDFRFNPPKFIIGFDFNNQSTFPLKGADGENGFIIGQFTEGYGTGNMCPDDPYPGFCQGDIQAYNPNGSKNFPPPPLRGQPVFPEDAGKFPGDVYPDQAVELRFPPFLRNPTQGPGAGDIIPPTGSWRPFLWINPNNGTLFIDENDPSKGHWADLTYSHGAPILANETLAATIELPRASGQVFYQFDDLFHDNVIFSPHPVGGDIEDPDEADTVERLQARMRGNSLQVKGRLSKLSINTYADWVTVFAGTAGESGCTGTVLGSAAVNPSGRFIFRQQEATVSPGASLCVQSPITAFAATALQ